ncbi:MAG: InlB B-repeat-containing protein, partial [bacterium]
ATGSDGGRLYRYSYNAAAKSYSLNAGFPVMVNNSLSETLVLAKDSIGKLWVTWTEGGKVKVNRSLGDDLTWGTPFDLPVQGTDTKLDDISSILAFGGNKIGIMWSNQNDKKSYFAVHLDDSADEVWAPKEQALADAALGAVSYDHINLKPSCDNDGNVYAATKTNLTQSGLPLVYLLKRTAAGVWTRYLVSTVDEGYIRPIILIDGAHHKIYVFATSEATSHRIIYMKSSDLSNIAFAPGLGTPFIQSVTDTVIMNPTSTKQCLNGATGLLVLAADQHTRTYLHNYLDLSGGVSQFALTVNTAPQGGGSVALDPPGGTYNAGTMVTLTATPNSGYQFSGWSGDLSGSTNPATTTMDGNKNVTATFTAVPSGGSIVHEESRTGGASGSTTVTTSASLTGASGHLYLAAISSRPKKLVQSVTGLGLTWTLVKSICSGNNSTT